MTTDHPIVGQIYKGPVYDAGAELGILQCILDNGGTAYAMLDHLKPHYFYDGRNVEAVASMSRLQRQGKPINAAALYLEMKQTPERMAELNRLTNPEYQWRYHEFGTLLAYVKDLAWRRTVIAGMVQIAPQLYDTRVESGQIREAIRGLL